MTAVNLGFMAGSYPVRLTSASSPDATDAPVAQNEVVPRDSLPSSGVSVALLSLEMKRAVNQLPEKLLVRSAERRILSAALGAALSQQRHQFLG